MSDTYTAPQTQTTTDQTQSAPSTSSSDPWSNWNGKFDQLPDAAKPYVLAAAKAAGVPLGIAAGHVWNESRGQIFDTPVGDNGAAHGPLQMHQDALTDYNRLHGTNFTLQDLHNPWTGTIVGLGHYRDLYDQTGDWPTASVAYAKGFGGAKTSLAPYTNPDGTIDYDKLAADQHGRDNLPDIMRNVYGERLTNKDLRRDMQTRNPGSYQVADLTGTVAPSTTADPVAAAQARAAATPVTTMTPAQSQEFPNAIEIARQRALIQNASVLKALGLPMTGAIVQPSEIASTYGSPAGTQTPRTAPPPAQAPSQTPQTPQGGYSVPPAGQMPRTAPPPAPAGLPAAPAGGSPAQGGGYTPAIPRVAPAQMPQMPYVQATPVPPMPANFAQNTQAPIPTPTNPYLAEHAGDAGLAMMLGGMSGKTLNNNPMVQAQQGLLNAGRYLVDAGGQQAQLAGQTNQFNALADQRAAQTALSRAQAWKALQDGNIQPVDAARINAQIYGTNATLADAAAQRDVAQRGQDIQLEAEKQRAMHTTGTPQLFVLPGQNPGEERTITQTRNQFGQEIYTDTQTGQQLAGLPAGAVPEKWYRDTQRTAHQEWIKTQPEIGKVFDAGAASRASLAQLDQLQQDLAKAGTLSGSDLASRLGRYIDQTTGSSIFGNVSDEAMAKMGLGSLGWNNTKTSAAGTGPLRVAEINRLSQLAPNINTPGPARDEFMQIMRDAAQRQVQISQDLRALQKNDPNNPALQSIGGLKGWLEDENDKYYKQLHTQREQQGGVLPQTAAPATTSAPQAGQRQMRPLTHFLTAQPTDAGVPPTP